MAIVKQILILGILTVLSWEDIRVQLLSARWLRLLLVTGIPVFLIRLADYGIGGIASLLPGFLLLIFSCLTKGGIGLGDAVVVIGLGLFLRGDKLCLILFVSMGLAMLWAGILFIRGRNGKQSFPMLPFLLAGYVGGMCLWESGG